MEGRIEEGIEAEETAEADEPGNAWREAADWRDSEGREEEIEVQSPVK